MSTIEGLLKAYSRFVDIPWNKTVAGPQRVWMAVYPPGQERRLHLRIDEFGIATKKTGRSWKIYNLTNEFAVWMANHDYREAYFEDPEALKPALSDFRAFLVERLHNQLTAKDVDDNTVVALIGAASCFGLCRVSRLLDEVNGYIRGRLLVFFPGELEGTNYRLLDARDGFDYLAIPIVAAEG